MSLLPKGRLPLLLLPTICFLLLALMTALTEEAGGVAVARGSSSGTSNAEQRMLELEKQLLELEKGTSRLLPELEKATQKVLNLNAYLQQLLSDAVEKGDLKRAETLVRNDGLDLDFKDKDNRPLIQTAIMKGHTELFKLLMEKGAKMDTKDANGYNALHAAVAHDRVDIIALVLNHPEGQKLVASKTERGLTPMHLASLHQDDAIMAQLLSAGALPQNIMDVLPEITITQSHIDKKEECGICIEPYKLGEVTVGLSCSHFFHKDCIFPWLKKKRICPICKQEVQF